MIIKLSSKWSAKLVALPESGMGYQRIDVRLKSGRLIAGLIVQNAEDLNIPESLEPFKEDEIGDIELSK